MPLGGGVPVVVTERGAPCAELPNSFTAETVKEYVVLGLSPPTV